MKYKFLESRHKLTLILFLVDLSYTKFNEQNFVLSEWKLDLNKYSDAHPTMMQDPKNDTRIIMIWLSGQSNFEWR